MSNYAYPIISCIRVYPYTLIKKSTIFIKKNKIIVVVIYGLGDRCAKGKL